MESRIKGRVLSIIVAAAMIASSSTALAATTKPTPKPTVKSTAKATVKPTAKATVKPTPKPSASPKVTKKPVTKKPVLKKTTAKKKTVYKRKVVKVSPSPSPKWPPSKAAGWTVNGEVYAKVPTNAELLGVLSAAAALASQVKPCSKFACGAVNIASTTGCTWWEINSTVSGPLSETDPTIVPYGTLRTTAKGTKAKQIITVLLISTEALKPKVTVGGINISCYHSPVTEKIPTNVYTPNTPSPSPSDTPTTNTN